MLLTISGNYTAGILTKPAKNTGAIDNISNSLLWLLAHLYDLVEHLNGTELSLINVISYICAFPAMKVLYFCCEKYFECCNYISAPAWQHCFSTFKPILWQQLSNQFFVELNSKKTSKETRRKRQ